MKKAAWKPAFFKPDYKWDANTIKKTSVGESQIFENCNFGMMMTAQRRMEICMLQSWS